MRPHGRPWTWCVALAVCASAAGAELQGPAAPITTQPAAVGPDVVMMRELVALYEPVPFDHRTHARMAEMWDGCVTCHHRTPAPTTRPALAAGTPATQDASATVPACKSCHVAASKAGDELEITIRMPSLKGAYHRQCLNCHRDWSGANDCVICHKPMDGKHPAKVEPTRDDIVGRMHPPLDPPDLKTYRTRFTPADGGNVVFRHAEHANGFGLRCVECHRHDNCSHCHDPKGQATRPVRHLLKPAENWRDSHGPCIGCHATSRCRTCHYRDGQPVPPPFAHDVTGQVLDKDHVKLGCRSCHATLRSKVSLTCGDPSCHVKTTAIAFPRQRPGPVVTTRPTSRPVMGLQGPMTGIER